MTGHISFRLAICPFLLIKLTMSTLTDQLSKIAERYDELEELMAKPEIVSDFSRLNELAQERTEIDELVQSYRRFQEIEEQVEGSRTLLSDPEMAELAELEIAELEEEQQELEQKMKLLLVPKDPNDERDVIMEIRAGAGGDEAGLFAAELLRMYTRWSENKKFKIELLNISETGVGGIKEAIMAVRGKSVFSFLKYESGVHRVQRVPATESQGRIHTSAAAVVVLPEADDIEIEIHDNDIKIDVFRSSGPGGQSVKRCAMHAKVRSARLIAARKFGPITFHRGA